MPRARSAAAPARTPSRAAPERGSQLLAEILNWKHEYALVTALLGPPGAGKTPLLERVSATARDQNFQVEYIDLTEARELWEVDRFYGWLVRKLREQWWGRAIRTSGPARLGFCTMLGEALLQRRQPVLLVLDHVESVPESCAHELIGDLREIQDRAEEKGSQWGRLRCVIAGCVSVFELRRKLNSPNLQFRLHILPNPDSAEAEEVTRRHLQDTHRLADDAVVRFLAQQSGGEPAFLSALDNYLQGPRIEMANAIDAVSSLLENACQYRHLCLPAYLYLLDQAFQEKADRMLAGLPVALPAPATDIDRYQLAGAWIAAGKVRSQPRFRNGLIEQVIRGVREQSGDGPIDQGLMKISRLQKFALGAGEIPGLVECVESAWHALIGMEGHVQILMGNRKTAFAVDGVAVTQVALPEHRGMEGNGHHAHTLIEREDDEWAVDTHWPESDESLILRVHPDKAFSPSVAAHEILRLWSLFVHPLHKVCLQLALQAIGRHAMRIGLTGPKKVFVSSTYLDLLDHRRAVLEQLVRRDLLFRGMEFFGAEPASPPPAEKIVREVRDADVYLGIFGVRYGSVDPKSGLSMTELEFNEAESSGKPMLLYAIRGDAKVSASDFNRETDAKREALLSRVKKHTVYQFETKEDLARQVYEDLGKL